MVIIAALASAPDDARYVQIFKALPHRKLSEHRGTIQRRRAISDSEIGTLSIPAFVRSQRKKALFHASLFRLMFVEGVERGSFHSSVSGKLNQYLMQQVWPLS